MNARPKRISFALFSYQNRSSVNGSLFAHKYFLEKYSSFPGNVISAGFFKTPGALFNFLL